ncbi:unnamed protein product [Orchesella dallaii]|uniref:Mitochondrial assembly of ribosomal large subunit protein 1 n=1 Tax=Orchesella dallaii TaxID=48710 RepID=A0ABP1Q3M8_9HEXA
MALFCSSCQKLSRLISRRPRPINDFKGARSGSFLQSRRSTNSNGYVPVFFKTENLTLKWNYSFMVSTSRTIYTFPNLSSRSTDTNDSPTFGKEKGKNVELSDEKDQRNEGSFENLTEEEQKLLRQLEEEGLTEEERKVLRELEEEERLLREELSSEDYSIWEGDVNVGSGKKEGLPNLSGSVSEEYVPFENRQRIIQDVIDEMWNPQPQTLEEEDEVPIYPRGKTGVFDLGELVDLLCDEKADEVVAITLPKEIDYADYMVIVTVGNDRHLLALATFIRRRFKMKERKRTDKLPFFDKSVKPEGWIALDLGNIILHIFLPEIRDYYDLETLWTVGPVFDDLSNAKDPEIVQLLNTL